MERSKFEKLADPQLMKYGEYVKSIIKGENDLLGDINKFYGFIIYSETEGARKIMAPVGGNLNREDIEYLFYILLYNNLKENTPLDRPVLTVETVKFGYEQKVTETITRAGDVETYLPGDLSNQYLGTLQNDEMIDPWEWRQIDSEEHDWDIMSEWFDL